MSKIFISWWEQVKKNRKTLLEKHSERMLKDAKKATFTSIISEVANVRLLSTRLDYVG